ncbi:MAG: prepilin-type N-terminal cleavage/methylation domain-containing protein [Ilumatobacter fluminis]|uniref:type II secretion system protein n=1 Tax=Ilumatobacter fluminis TaxID=467091 RepID=UPI0032EB98B9
MKKQDEGFTLIELLIVIVILGILATVVVFSVRGITDDGQQNACDTDYRTLEVAVEAYYAQYGSAGGDPSDADLVAAGLIRTGTSENYTVTNGSISAVSPGDC